jgi:hypothetical protein
MNKSKIEERLPEPKVNQETDEEVISVSPSIAKPNVSGWVSFSQGYPDENETVWLYNSMNNFVALGCHVWTGEDSGWVWALSNGIIYSENGKIVSECESDDDYAFTHWCRLPTLPCH